MDVVYVVYAYVVYVYGGMGLIGVCHIEEVGLNKV
jgi:hypothetical protein